MATAWLDRRQSHQGTEDATTDESAYEAFAKIGVIGSMQLGADDLATNPCPVAAHSFASENLPA